MSPGSNTESYPAFARIGLRENPGKNLNQYFLRGKDNNGSHYHNGSFASLVFTAAVAAQGTQKFSVLIGNPLFRFPLPDGRDIMEKKWEYKGTVHQLFIDFKKAYDSVKREVLYDILIGFGIPKKLVRLIKMCLSETYSRVRIEELTGSRQIHVEAELSHLFRIPRIPSVSLHDFEGHQDCGTCAMLGRGDRMELSELFV
ncbi:hypothetical protein ANN_16196 [Periplaneta americana]|uniref:Reverse transcriptase domain-containing protein n=1 Tax=Periplaneta americana TaxID=6978 RepID=A0ABQ8SIR8_PERAM|nr:hypothetical protein ANN_16196 [Periplaneta americana]